MSFGGTPVQRVRGLASISSGQYLPFSWFFLFWPMMFLICFPNLLLQQQGTAVVYSSIPKLVELFPHLRRCRLPSPLRSTLGSLSLVVFQRYSFCMRLLTTVVFTGTSFIYGVFTYLPTGYGTRKPKAAAVSLPHELANRCFYFTTEYKAAQKKIL